MFNFNSDKNTSYNIAGSAFGDGGIFDFSEDTSSFTAISLDGPTYDAKGGGGGGGGGGRGGPPSGDDGTDDGTDDGPYDDDDTSFYARYEETGAVQLPGGTYTSGRGELITNTADTTDRYAMSDYNISVNMVGSDSTDPADNPWIVQEVDVHSNLLFELDEDGGQVLDGDGVAIPIMVDLSLAFIEASEFISSFITEGRPDYIASQDPNNFFSFDIDDLYITAELKPIDGAGGTNGNILGSAGPDYLLYDVGETSSDALTFGGSMTFDVYDAALFYALGLWDTIILHEMMHVMGVGTLWDWQGLVEAQQIGGLDTKKPTDNVYVDVFTGETTTALIDETVEADDGSMITRYAIVEEDGGAGTAGGHWDELLYDAELMTGYIEGLDENGNNINYLSSMTVASIADLGYAVDSGFLDVLADATINPDYDPYLTA